MRLPASALIMPDLSKIRRGAPFPPLGFLLLRHRDGFLETAFDLAWIRLFCPEKQASPEPMNLCLIPADLVRLCHLQCFIQQRQPGLLHHDAGCYRSPTAHDNEITKPAGTVHAQRVEPLRDFSCWINSCRN